MADDKKLNALLGKFRGKKRTEPEYSEEQDKLGEFSEADVENADEDAESDYTPDWLTDTSEDSFEDSDEDITESLAELFGESNSESSETDGTLAITGFEELAAAGEINYDLYDTEPSEECETEENGYVEQNSDFVGGAESPAESYGEDVYEGSDDEIDSFEDSSEYEDTDLDPSADESSDDSEEAEDTAASVDEDTANLLAALGYSEANAARNRKIDNKDSRQNHHTDLSLAYGYDGKEYSARSQIASVKAKYAEDKLKTIIRLGATALFAILICVYDMFGNKLGGVLDAAVYPVVNIMISLQLLLIAAAFSVRRLLSGAKAILKGDLNVHSISTIAVLIAVIYDIILAIILPDAFTLYNFPAAVCLCLCAIHDYISLEREICVFGRLSSWQSVATLERVDAGALAVELGESDNRNVSHTVGQAFRLRKGDFAENYFRHINRRHPLSKLLMFFVTPAVALAFIMFFISLASDKSLVQATNTFVGVSLISMPAFMLVSMSFPFFKLITKTLNVNSVILSESDVNEYRRVDTVVFEESDLFDDTSLTINRISVCDKNQMQDVFDIMCTVSAMYNMIGGRIAGAFRASTADGEIPSDVSVIRVDDGGFEGMAEGRYYCVGSDTYLASKGIAVTRYYDDKYIESNPGGVVLHIAVDGAEVFKLYLTYNISQSTLSIINQLASLRTRIVLRTIDPNVNLDLISRILSDSFGGNLTLVRKPYSEESSNDCHKNEGLIDGGIIVNGDAPAAILSTVSACGYYSAFSKLNFGAGIVTFAVGVVLAFILGIFGLIVDLPSICIFIFQIISILPSIFFASVYLNK